MELDEWRELFVHQFIQGAGLLDAPSGLRVHEGVIFPNSCSSLYYGGDCADSTSDVTITNYQPVERKY